MADLWIINYPSDKPQYVRIKGYRGFILDFVVWCELNHQLLNRNKTKELVVDLSRLRLLRRLKSFCGHSMMQW